MSSVEISYADFSIIVLTVIFGYEGYRSGFFKGILSLGGFFISLTVSLAALPYAARFFNYVIELPPNISILMGFLSIFVINMLLYALFLEWVNKIMEMKVNEEWFDRIAGTLLGLYKGVLAVSLLALGFTILPLPELVQRTEQRSLFLQPVKYFTPVNYNYFKRLVPRTPSFEETIKSTFAVMGGEPDPMAAGLMESFRSRQLEKSVTTKP
jgi:uncharacterized membrane protein required for colicin V production